MLEIRSPLKLNDIEPVLKRVAQRHNAHVTVISHLGQPHLVEGADRSREALVFTFYHPKLHTALLNADIRFAGFLPCRVAVWPDEDGVMLQAISPSEFCQFLGRPELMAQVAPLDGILQNILNDAAKPMTVSAKGRQETGPHHWGATEDQVNMRAALPQRIDYRGTKVEDEAGTGSHDAPGG